MLLEFLVILILVIMTVLSLLLIALASIFKMINQEEINVKKLLGYSFIQIYRRPLLLLILSIILEMIVMVLGQSRLGICVVSLVGLIELMIFWIYVSRDTFQSIIKEFKE